MNILIGPTSGTFLDYSYKLFHSQTVSGIQKELDDWVKECRPKIVGTQLTAHEGFVLEVIYLAT